MKYIIYLCVSIRRVYRSYSFTDYYDRRTTAAAACWIPCAADFLYQCIALTKSFSQLFVMNENKEYQKHSCIILKVQFIFIEIIKFQMLKKNYLVYKN